jgi:hypothetical protein
MVNFDNLNNHVWCYAHIINICSSHIISLVTSVSKWYLSKLKVPIDSNSTIHNESNDELDDGNIDTDHDIDELDLDNFYDDCGNSKLKEWIAGIKCDPLRRARRIIHLLQSSDQCRKGFHRFIQDRNEQNWFSEKTDTGKWHMVQVPMLQLLRDVKTRWDSVYLILQYLRSLQPVSLSQLLDNVAD